MKRNFVQDLVFKYRLYGPRYFVIFSLIEIKRIILRTLKISYSQYGEDRWIANNIGLKNIKSYIDIGANEAVKFNNTYLFYINGARGVVIEPIKDLYREIKKCRPKDTCLNIGLGDKRCTKNFYRLDPHVKSTFSKKEADKAIKSGCKLVDVQKIEIKTLQDIFGKYIKKNKVDLISIDAEGYDYEILKGLDWKKYRAKIIIIEDRSKEIDSFLDNNGYKLAYRNELNSIYLDSFK
jgi:FkbM family methyltransferase